jgi:hypothetical protein
LSFIEAPRQCQDMGLLGPVAAQPSIPAQFPTDGRIVAPYQLSNLCLAIFHFLQDVNLVSFLLGKLRVAHLRSSYFGRLEKAAMLPQLAFGPIL